MEYYSAIKKNEIMSVAGKWMELETIMLRIVIQVQKDKDCMFSIICERKIQMLSIYTNTNMMIYIYIYIACLQ
jgi:hypothetical protein